MSFDAEKLYNLLPAVHRLRDAELGEQLAADAGEPGEGGSFRPLRQLIGVIGGQVGVVEENLEQLYDNQFVETAAPWALPYLGELLGIRGLSGGGKLSRAPRPEVGHTIAYRRRKGTAAMLEMLAHDVTGWPARALEFFERLATTQYLNHLRPHNRAFVSLRQANDLEFFNTAFETAARTAEVRRIKPSRGKWNIPNVGLFLWRLRAYSLTRTPLTPAAASLADNRHFRFHPLGFDVPLFSLPETEDEFTHLAEPLNVPIPITRRMLCGKDYAAVPKQFHPSADYYGRGRSLLLERKVIPVLPGSAPSFQAMVATEIVVADLGDVKDKDGNPAWGHEAFAQSQNMVLLDPMRGRVLFRVPPAEEIFATFHYGFSMNLGGGEYDRARASGPRAGFNVQVPDPDSAKPQNVGAGLQALGARDGVVEIMNSSRYVETFTSIDATGRHVEISAADQRRPTVLLNQPLDIKGDANGLVTLNGLLISGEPIQVSGALGRLRLRHCTIVPWLTVDSKGTPALSKAPALTVNSTNTVVEIEECIIGPIRVGPDVTMRLKNSIVDAAATSDVALANLNGSGPAGTWRIENCSVRGKVQLSILELASNTIFLGDLAAADDPKITPPPLFVQRRQEGCVRFCWLPRGARVPRRYECLPRPEGPEVRPVFTSLRFGDAGYGQLGRFCPDAILRGADDESEIGAFHDLLQPQREAHLRTRLDEYLRFGLEAGIFYAT